MKQCDYGYFGKGAEGYAHYKQTFDSTTKGSRSNGSYIPKAKKQESVSDEVDILLKIVVPLVVLMFVFLK